MFQHSRIKVRAGTGVGLNPHTHTTPMHCCSSAVYYQTTSCHDSVSRPQDVTQQYAGDTGCQQAHAYATGANVPGKMCSLWKLSATSSAVRGRRPVHLQGHPGNSVAGNSVAHQFKFKAATVQESGQLQDESSCSALAELQYAKKGKALTVTTNL